VNTGLCGAVNADQCPDTSDCSENGDDDCDAFIAGLGVPVCCQPFSEFNLSADVCKAAGIEDGDRKAGNTPPCCDPSFATGEDPPFNVDFFCKTQANRLSCCNAIAADYPEPGAAQQPQLPANPCNTDVDCGTLTCTAGVCQ
jgi:hypothetical protein